MAKSPWTDERVSVLRQMWADGHSSTMIARRLGLSRNAVLGKAWRLDLAYREPTKNSFYDPVHPKRFAKRRKPTKSAKTATFWTPLRLWNLKTWVKEGLTSRQIEAKLNGAVSSASIRNKIKREGLLLKHSRGRVPTAPVREVPKEHNPEHMERVPFLEVRPNQCRWPLWAPDEKIGECCGNKTPVSQPYCDHHMAVGYTPGTAINQQPRKVA